MWYLSLLCKFTVFYEFFLSQLFEHLPHSVDALALLLQIGVNIEVEGGADVGVAEEDANGLVVAFALDAAGSETVPEAVEAHFG